LDCSEYIGKYLAAQADDELAPHEHQLAAEHLVRCAACRASLAEERSLKALLRRNAGIVRTPPDVRLRIRAALGEIAETYPGRHLEPRLDRRPERHANSSNREATALRESITRAGVDHDRDEVNGRNARRWSRDRWWAAAGGLTAVLIITLAIFAGRAANQFNPKSIPAVPAFDLAINKYLALERDFAPNVPPEAYSNLSGIDYAWVQSRDPVQRITTESTDKLDDVARAYRELSMPDDLLDLSPAGYTLSGARAERLPDGRPIVYTLHTGISDTILSIIYADASMAAPVGAVNWLGMRSFYEYKGYSICMSFYPDGHFVSIMLSRMPVQQMLEDVASADADVASK
jgi:hypothetical protein